MAVEVLPEEAAKIGVARGGGNGGNRTCNRRHVRKPPEPPGRRAYIERIDSPPESLMSFIVSGLPLETFQPLFGLDDDALAARGALRVTAEDGRYPCRVTLEDAPVGQSLLLVNYQHQDAATPYRSNYAIYVSEAARRTRRLAGELPPVLRGRPIAIRAFDDAGMLIGAELALNDDVEAVIARRFSDPEAAYLHAHNAAHGCFAARIDRA